MKQSSIFSETAAGIRFKSLPISFCVPGWLESRIIHTGSTSHRPVNWLDFTRCYRFSTDYAHLTCQRFIYKHSAFAKTTIKSVNLPFLVQLPTLGSLASFASALLLGRSTCIPHGIRSLGHMLNSFVHMGPIIIINRPCHGSWISLGDSTM